MKRRAKRKRISDLPKSQRPRERMRHLGVTNLTVEELLAVILGSGSRKRNVLGIAKRIAKKKDLSTITYQDLIGIHGIGSIGAGKILAGIELGKRIWQGSAATVIETPEDVVREVRSVRSKSREYLIALYLNARFELLSRHTVAIGSLNTSMVEPRDVFSEAVALPCAYIVLVHNHPSGDPSPSDDDTKLTKQMKKAGKLLGIEIIDHIIVSSNDYTSFREMKLL